MQEKMLLLQKETAQIELTEFYKKTKNHFNHVAEQYKDAKKGQDTFFFKKQSQMILRYLEELSLDNQNLPKVTEKEIIEIFEKQYKLKKIIRKFAAFHV